MKQGRSVGMSLSFESADRKRRVRNCNNVAGVAIYMRLSMFKWIFITFIPQFYTNHRTLLCTVGSLARQTADRRDPK